MPKRKKNDSAEFKNDGDRLAILRGYKGVTQKDFAELVGISLSSYQDYEAGKRPVPLKVRRAIWGVFTLEVNPADASEDPKKILRQIQALNPDAIYTHPILETETNSKAEPIVLAKDVDASSKNEAPVRRSRLIGPLIAFRTRYFEYTASLGPFGRTYLEVRNWIMLVALHYISMKAASVQLGFRFGAPAGQTDYALVISFGLGAVLLVAFLQSTSHAFRRI